MPQLFNETGFNQDNFPGFPFDFDRVYPLQIIFATNVLTHEDGTEQRVCDMPNPVRVWEGILLAQDGTKKSSIEGFFDAKVGSENTFTFIDPMTATSHRVRLDRDSLTFTKIFGDLWDVTMVLREVL